MLALVAAVRAGPLDSMLDVRDGGFQPWAGWAAALGYAELLALRRRLQRGQWCRRGSGLVAGSAAAAVSCGAAAGLPAWQGVALDGAQRGGAAAAWPNRGGELVGQLVARPATGKCRCCFAGWHSSPVQFSG